MEVELFMMSVTKAVALFGVSGCQCQLAEEAVREPGIAFPAGPD